MQTDEPQYWPFPVLADEQLTTEQREEVVFLRTMFDSGYRPCKFLEREYRVEGADGREAWLIYRGRARRGEPARWEIWLDDGASRIATHWVDDFASGTDTARHWLAGSDACEVAKAVGSPVSRSASERIPAGAERKHVS